SKEVRQTPVGRHANELAFTLVEVMVALSIVAIGMLAAFSAVNQIVSDTTYLRNKTLADWIAMNQLTDMRLEGGLPEIGESDGEVEFAEQDWRWEARVSETPVESMRRIEIDVTLANEPDTVLITLSGFAGGALNLQTLSSPWLTGVPGLPPEGPEGPVPEDPDGG
ncbi:MAG: type II secretion system minor pseudopilin GspI, partial [Gammaproteobacteria bacterium]